MEIFCLHLYIHWCLGKSKSFCQREESLPPCIISLKNHIDRGDLCFNLFIKSASVWREWNEDFSLIYLPELVIMCQKNVYFAWQTHHFTLLNDQYSQGILLFIYPELDKKRYFKQSSDWKRNTKIGRTIKLSSCHLTR